MSQQIPSARATSAIRIDGSLEEPAWAQAPVFDGFVQLFPSEGAPPSERTELRVVYDDRFIYFGIRCHDSRPAEINRKLGRRDNPPTSDTIQVFIDSSHDHRTAYSFGLNAGGVQFDGLVLSDTDYTPEWDATWDGASAALPDGWSAELAVPLSALRFTAAPEHIWGLGVQRHLARAHEDISSVLIPKSAKGKVSRFGHLTELRGMNPRPSVDLTPYVAARGVLRPQLSDPGTPDPRLMDPSLDVGLDLNAALTSDLALNATVNPDFGQVEADQIILNLSNVEQLFPEKRPFFTQGMDLFAQVPILRGAPQRLFYSRRIGLTTPILAAAKLTGTVAPTLQVGLLDAFVLDAPPVPVDEANPDRRLELALERPLHLGPRDERAGKRPITENYLVGVARKEVFAGSHVGARITAATPLAGSCSPEDAALAPSLQPVSCLAAGGNAGAFDWDLRTPNAEWVLRGQLDGSQVVGGPPERTLRDGVLLRRGDLGWGTYVEGGKLGGEPFRFALQYHHSSPRLELNAAGFLASQNVQTAIAIATFTRPNGLGPLHSLDVSVVGEERWTTDGRMIDRGRWLRTAITAVVPGFHTVIGELGHFAGSYDVREINGTGIPFQKAAQAWAIAQVVTDRNQPLSIDALGLTNLFLGNPSAEVALAWSAGLNVTFRPEQRLETKLMFAADSTPYGPRFVDFGAPGQFIFGDLFAHYMSVTLQQQWVLAPRLTIQGYAQLFTNFGQYRPFYEGRSTDRAPINIRDLVPFNYPVPVEFRGSALNLNLVLRWEYRPGSTAFLVYTRSQAEPPSDPSLPLPSTWLPVNLFSGPVTDALLLKLSYRWDL